jgi:cation diffusion facilitator family transporter
LNTASKVGIYGVIGNIFLFLIKFFIGIVSKSQAMIADSINSATDIFASLMTFIGSKISSVPNDDDHNFGHGKAEYIFSMLISISMMALSVKIFYDSLLSIINNNKIIFSKTLIIVCIITILTKLGLYIYTKVINKENNLLVRANMIDHRNDILLTSLTLVAIILSYFNIYWIDGVVGMFIGIWIFLSSINIFIESYNILMDEAIDVDSKDLILAILKENKDIKRIGTLYSVPIGNKYIVVLTIYVDGNMKTNKSHAIADEMSETIVSIIPKIQNVIIHVEPYNHKK